jgi:hypothetical protein
VGGWVGGRVDEAGNWEAVGAPSPGHATAAASDTFPGRLPARLPAPASIHGCHMPAAGPPSLAGPPPACLALAAGAVTFSSRLTKMETKMYESFNGTGGAGGWVRGRLGVELAAREGGRILHGR